MPAGARTRRDILASLPIGLLFLYPLWAHVAILLDAAPWAAWWLVAALVPMALIDMARRHLASGLAAGGAALSISALMLNGNVLAPLYLQPFVVCGALLLVFGRSLVPGETPMVTLFARALGEDVDREIAAYTRNVTWLWTGVFTLMLIELAALALWADTATWSLFANILNYLFVLLVFAAEFRVRVTRFGRARSPSFSRFLVSLARLRGNRAGIGTPR